MDPDDPRSPARRPLGCVAQALTGAGGLAATALYVVSAPMFVLAAGFHGESFRATSPGPLDQAFFLAVVAWALGGPWVLLAGVCALAFALACRALGWRSGAPTAVAAALFALVVAHALATAGLLGLVGA